MASGRQDRAPGDIGHYFDQTLFDLHMMMQQWRASRLAIEMELEALGVSINPETGKVTVSDRSETTK